MHGRADGDPTTPDVERAAAARARRTLIPRDRVSGCRCRCGPGAGGGRRSAAGAGQHRGPGRRLHWLTLPAPAATHWSPRCTIVASRAKGRDAQRDPRKTSEKLEGAGVGVRGTGYGAELGGRGITGAGRVRAGAWSWVCASKPRPQE